MRELTAHSVSKFAFAERTEVREPAQDEVPPREHKDVDTAQNVEREETARFV